MRPWFRQYFFLNQIIRSPDSVVTVRSYVVCVIGSSLHIWHRSGFLILISFCRRGRWSTFFFRNHSWCLFSQVLLFLQAVPFFPAFRTGHLVSVHPALIEEQDMKNELVQLVCSSDVLGQCLMIWYVSEHIFRWSIDFRLLHSMFFHYRFSFFLVEIEKLRMLRGNDKNDIFQFLTHLWELIFSKKSITIASFFKITTDFSHF